MERDLIDPIAVTAIQHVLDASKVQVFTAGRQDLAAVSYTHLRVLSGM